MLIDKCRYCASKLQMVFSLGKMPIVNYFPTLKDLKKEKKYPLELMICKSCNLMQTSYDISPDKLFRRAHYISGASEPLVKHLEVLAQSCIKTYKLAKGSKILDIGSNDGSFLKSFKGKGMICLGVEPSINAVKLSKKNKIKAINKLFTKKLATSIKKKYGVFDLISCTHTLANIINLKDFLTGVKLLLKDTGVFTLEVGSGYDMIKSGFFDAIYHEHFYYFTSYTLGRLMDDAGLFIEKIEKNSFHGASIRAYIRKKRVGDIPLKFGQEKLSVRQLAKFKSSVMKFKKGINALLDRCKTKKIIGFGAPAKGVILLNFLKLGPDRIDFVVDSTTFKQGRYVPGAHIPIYAEDRLTAEHPNVVFILAWNFTEAIVKKVEQMTNRQVKLLLPFPRLQFKTYH